MVTLTDQDMDNYKSEIEISPCKEHSVYQLYDRADARKCFKQDELIDFICLKI